MDSSAIELIQNTAIDAKANRLPGVDPDVADALPPGYTVQDLEKYQPFRRRYRGIFDTASLADFVTYTKANEGGQVFVGVDGAELGATAFFNLGNTAQPGHADWRARLDLPLTPAYRALLGINGKGLEQQQVIDFIEDWSYAIAAASQSGEDTYVNMPLNKAVTAIRKVKIEAKSSTETERRNFGESQSRLESIDASSEVGLPDMFFFTTEPYLGLYARRIALRLSVMTGGQKPMLRFRIIGLEQLTEDIAQEFKEKLISQIGDSAKVYLGEFKP